MYEISREITLSGGTASPFSNNLHVIKPDSKSLWYGVINNKSQLSLVSWDQKMEGFQQDVVAITDAPVTAASTKGSKPLIVTQAKYCKTSSKEDMFLVVCTTTGVMFYDSKAIKMLLWHPVPKSDGSFLFSKGIANIGETICVGIHTGELLVFAAKASMVKHKSVLNDQKGSPMVDISSDEKTTFASLSTDGTIVVSDANLKLINKISTKQPFSCILVHSGLVFLGSVLGQIVVYHGKSGEIHCEIGAHARAVSALHIGPAANLLLSVSEDSFARVWKYNISEPLEISLHDSMTMPNVSLVGGQFLNDKGTSYAVVGYDYSTMYFLEKKKKK